MYFNPAHCSMSIIYFRYPDILILTTYEFCIMISRYRDFPCSSPRDTFCKQVKAYSWEMDIGNRRYPDILIQVGFRVLYLRYG